MKKTLRLIITLHRVIGLFLGLNFFLLCITGSILVWKDELSDNHSEVVAHKEVVLDQNHLIKIKKYLDLNFPNKKILAIFHDEAKGFQARVTDEDVTVFKGATRVYFDEKAELSSAPIKQDSFIQIILDLHRNLLWPGKGKYLIGLIGVFLLFLIISGSIFSKNFSKVSNIKNLKSLFAIWHKGIGNKFFSWIFIVTISGIILSFNSIIIGIFLKTSVTGYTPNQNISQSMMNFESVITNLNKNEPNFDIDFLSFPNNEFSKEGLFVSLLEGKSDNTVKKIVFLDSSTGEIQESRKLPWYLQLLLISEPLHYGDYGGLPLKLFWTTLGIVFAGISITGIYIFLVRKNYLNDTEISTISYNLKRFQFSWGESTFLFATLILLYFFQLEGSR